MSNDNERPEELEGIENSMAQQAIDNMIDEDDDDELVNSNHVVNEEWQKRAAQASTPANEFSQGIATTSRRMLNTLERIHDRRDGGKRKSKQEGGENTPPE